MNGCAVSTPSSDLGSTPLSGSFEDAARLHSSGRGMLKIPFGVNCAAVVAEAQGSQVVALERGMLIQVTVSFWLLTICILSSWPVGESIFSETEGPRSDKVNIRSNADANNSTSPADREGRDANWVAPVSLLFVKVGQSSQVTISALHPRAWSTLAFSYSKDAQLLQGKDQGTVGHSFDDDGGGHVFNIGSNATIRLNNLPVCVRVSRTAPDDGFAEREYTNNLLQVRGCHLHAGRDKLSTCEMSKLDDSMPEGVGVRIVVGDAGRSGDGGHPDGDGDGDGDGDHFSLGRGVGLQVGFGCIVLTDLAAAGVAAPDVDGKGLGLANSKVSARGKTAFANLSALRRESRRSPTTSFASYTMKEDPHATPQDEALGLESAEAFVDIYIAGAHAITAAIKCHFWDDVVPNSARTTQKVDNDDKSDEKFAHQREGGEVVLSASSTPSFSMLGEDSQFLSVRRQFVSDPLPSGVDTSEHGATTGLGRDHRREGPRGEGRTSIAAVPVQAEDKRVMELAPGRDALHGVDSRWDKGLTLLEGGHARVVSGGVVRRRQAECREGYSGAACEDCAPGYLEAEEGACQLISTRKDWEFHKCARTITVSILGVLVVIFALDAVRSGKSPPRRIAQFYHILSCGKASRSIRGLSVVGGLVPASQRATASGGCTVAAATDSGTWGRKGLGRFLQGCMIFAVTAQIITQGVEVLQLELPTVLEELLSGMEGFNLHPLSFTGTCELATTTFYGRVQSSLASLTACLTFLFLSFLTVKRREGCLPRHKRQGRQRSSSNTTSIAASRRQTFKKTSSAAVIDVSGRLRPSLQLRHAERSLGRRQPSPRILEGSGAHGAWDRWRRWKPWERHASAAVLTCLLLHPVVCTTLLQLFDCRSIEGKEGLWLVSDDRITCNSEKHGTYKVIAATFLGLYGVGIPVALFAASVWAKSSSEDTASRSSLTRKGNATQQPRTLENRRNNGSAQEGKPCVAGSSRGPLNVSVSAEGLAAAATPSAELSGDDHEEGIGRGESGWTDDNTSAFHDDSVVSSDSGVGSGVSTSELGRVSQPARTNACDDRHEQGSTTSRIPRVTLLHGSESAAGHRALAQDAKAQRETKSSDARSSNAVDEGVMLHGVKRARQGRQHGANLPLPQRTTIGDRRVCGSLRKAWRRSGRCMLAVKRCISDKTDPWGTSRTDYTRAQGTRWRAVLPMSSPYLPNRRWFAAWELLRRSLLTGLLVLIPARNDGTGNDGTGEIRVVVACGISGLCLVIGEVAQPYRDAWVRWIYRMGGVMISLVYVIGLVQQVSSADARSSVVVALACLFIFFMGFIILCVVGGWRLSCAEQHTNIAATIIPRTETSSTNVCRGNRELVPNSANSRACGGSGRNFAAAVGADGRDIPGEDGACPCESVSLKEHVGVPRARPRGAAPTDVEILAKKRSLGCGAEDVHVRQMIPTLRVADDDHQKSRPSPVQSSYDYLVSGSDAVFPSGSPPKRGLPFTPRQGQRQPEHATYVENPMFNNAAGADLHMASVSVYRGDAELFTVATRPSVAADGFGGNVHNRNISSFNRFMLSRSPKTGMGAADEFAQLRKTEDSNNAGSDGDTATKGPSDVTQTRRAFQLSSAEVSVASAAGNSSGEGSDDSFRGLKPRAGKVSGSGVFSVERRCLPPRAAVHAPVLAPGAPLIDGRKWRSANLAKRESPASSFASTSFESASTAGKSQRRGARIRRLPIHWQQKTRSGATSRAPLPSRTTRTFCPNADDESVMWRSTSGGSASVSGYSDSVSGSFASQENGSLSSRVSSSVGRPPSLHPLQSHSSGEEGFTESRSNAAIALASPGPPAGTSRVITGNSKVLGSDRRPKQEARGGWPADAQSRPTMPEWWVEYAIHGAKAITTQDGLTAGPPPDFVSAVTERSATAERDAAGGHVQAVFGDQNHFRERRFSKAEGGSSSVDHRVFVRAGSSGMRSFDSRGSDRSLHGFSGRGCSVGSSRGGISEDDGTDSDETPTAKASIAHDVCDKPWVGEETSFRTETPLNSAELNQQFDFDFEDEGELEEEDPLSFVRVSDRVQKINSKVGDARIGMWGTSFQRRYGNFAM